MINLQRLGTCICCTLIFLSCNDSNSLKQANAEKVIKNFLMTHNVLRQGQKPDTTSISIGKPNVYSQFYTSVKVDVTDSSQQPLTLLFDFKRSPKNEWVLLKVESADKNEELNKRIIPFKNLNIPTQ